MRGDGRTEGRGIAFVGGGVMAEAMLAGILEAGIARPEEVAVGEPVEARRRHLTERHGVAATDDNAAAVRDAHLVVLAVKPQDLPAVFRDLGGSLRRGQVVLSIVAGARLETLARGLQHEAVVRVIPNTPAQIGQGMSVWTATPQVSQAAREEVAKVLRTLGEEQYVPEEKFIDMATAVSASGPAYVFLFIEAMTDAGVYLGFPREVARKLVLQTVLGSARLVQETGRHPAELSNMVTSPGGTTAEALRAFEEGGLRATVLRAVDAAYRKSVALGGDR